MKKVLSFVLVLVLVLGSFSFAFAGTATTAVNDIAGTPYENAVRVLMSLDIIEGYADGTFKPDGAVTRAEMAAMIVRALGLDTTSSFVAKSNYSDMNGHWADKYVALVSGKNIVKGYPDGTFKPNNQVSFPEAVTMIIRALGYTDGCTSLLGTWPANYMTLATDLDILDDLKMTDTEEAADRGNVAIMIYNALDVANVTVDKEDMSAVKVVIEEDDDDPVYLTFLSKLDVTEEDMKISADDAGDEDTLCDLTPYVYAWVTVYKNDDGQIIGVKKIIEKSDVDKNARDNGEYTDYVTGIIDIDSKALWDGFLLLGPAYVPEQDDQDTTTVTDQSGKVTYLPAVHTGADFPVYLNGEETSYSELDYSETLADLGIPPVQDLLDFMVVTVYGQKDEHGDFTTIDGIIATAPTGEYQATDSDISDITDAIEDGNGEVFDVVLPTVDDDDEELDLTDITVVGAATSLADIKEDDVVSVFASGDYDKPDKVMFVVTRQTVEFTVKKVDGGHWTVYDNEGKAYNCSVDMVNYGMYDKMGPDPASAFIKGNVDLNDFEVGTTYKAYLNSMGWIFGIDEVDSEAGNYAIVVSYKNDTTFDDAQIKLFTKDGDTETFDVDSDAFEDADADGYFKDGDGNDELTDLVATGCVIEYDTNASGDVDEITVLDHDSDYTAHAAVADVKYKSSSDTYNSDDIASDAVFFDLTGDHTSVTWAAIAGTTTRSDAMETYNTDDDDWDVYNKLTNDTEYSAYYYLNDDDEIVAMLIFDSEDQDNNYFAVNSRSKAEDSDGDDVFALDGYAGNTATSDVLTTNDTVFNSSYSVPGIYVVDYDGDKIDSADRIVYANRVAVSAAVDPSSDPEINVYWNLYVSKSGSGDYFKTYTTSFATSGTEQGATLDSEAVIYVAVYDDGEIDHYKVGKISDIDKGDMVIYITNEDGDVELVIVTDADDITDAQNNGDI